MLNLPGCYLCVERKEDSKLFYFINNDIMEAYLKENGEDNFEFAGMQFLEDESELIKDVGDAEVVALMQQRREKLLLMKRMGLDTSKLKEFEIDGEDNPDETEEEVAERKSDHRKKNMKVVAIDEDGNLVETDENVDDFIEERKEESRPIVEKIEEVIKKYLDEKGFEYSSENTGNKVSDIEERFNEYAKQYRDAGNDWSEMQERISEEVEELVEQMKNKEADENEDPQKVNNRKMAAFAIEDLKKRCKEEGIRLPALKGMTKRFEILTKIMDKYIRKTTTGISEDDLVKELWSKYKAN